jgi:integrase
VRAVTLASYQQVLREYVRPELASVRLDKLTPLHLQGMVSKLVGRGLKPRTVRYALAILGGALRKAVRLRLIPFSPMAEVDLPRQPRRELRVPVEPTRARLLAELRADALWPLWCLMATAGIRPGEGLRLKWSDLDSAADTVTVQRSLSRLKGGRWELTEPKTAQGRDRRVASSGRASRVDAPVAATWAPLRARLYWRSDRLPG